ncbi:MAG: hypothetical protein HZB29_09400 [Nitrospinae bacterium]|nr:hypothetical protein [Nitrospinota bacterium]
MSKITSAAGLVFMLFAASCGGGSSSSTYTAAASSVSIYNSLPGTWDVRLYGPVTSCSTLDLGSFAGDGERTQRIFSTHEDGEIKYVTIALADPADTASPLEYTVTSDGDPLRMERSYEEQGATCVWTLMRSYELTLTADGRLTGYQNTDITSASSACEQCYYTLEVEMTPAG